MPKTKTARPKKRGPKEDRLVISEEPSAALQRLLTARKPTTKAGK
jgi:hypothetical protein